MSLMKNGYSKQKNVDKEERLRYYLDKVEIFRDEFFAVIHDEDTSNIQFDVILLLFVFEKIEGCSLGDEQKGAEF